MVDIPKYAIQRETSALPPIKLDDKTYVIVDGTYTVLWAEQLITERYACDGGIDRQVLKTSAYRFKMTLLVPTDISNIIKEDASIPTPAGTTFGSRADLHTTVLKTTPVSLYDITNNWDWSGDPDFNVYVVIGEEAPNTNDIGWWQIPVDLWGVVYS